MKDETTPRGHESPSPEDDRLVKDLESLSKTIGSLDHFEVDTDIDEDPAPYYKILQIGSEASLTDIHNAFEKMNAAWNPDRYPQIISWNEKAKKKLKEIRNAYEKLLRLHPRRESASQGGTSSAPVSLHATTEVRPEYSNHDQPSPGFTASPSPISVSTSSAAESPSLSIADSAATDSATSTSAIAGLSGNIIRRIIIMGLPTVIILILAFLWPSLYHYEAIHLGGKEYPLRINRVTSQATYYNGKQWLAPPVQVEVMQQEAAKAPPLQPVQQVVPPMPAQPVQPLQSAQPTLPATPPPPVQSVQPIQPAQTVQPQLQARPSQPPLTSKSSGTEFAVEGKPSSTKQQKVVPRRPEKKIPPPKVATSKANIPKPYSIQITAYPEKEKAVALAKRLREGKIPARVEEVSIKGKGRWHRVLLGNFKNRDEALKYFNDHKIGQLYPQSFIQKPATH